VLPKYLVTTLLFNDVCQLPTLQNPHKHYPKIIDYIWLCLLLLTYVNRFYSLGFSTSGCEMNLQRRSLLFAFSYLYFELWFTLLCWKEFLLACSPIIYYFKRPLITNKGSVVRVCDLLRALDKDFLLFFIVL